MVMLSCKSDGCTVQLTYAAELVRVQIQRLTMYPKLSFRAYFALQKKTKYSYKMPNPANAFPHNLT
jgi:hypothetical protein